MNGKTVVILGAGATKACGGPLTNDILWQAYNPRLRQQMKDDGYTDTIGREGYADLLEEFLIQNFNVPRDERARKRGDYPALPLLLSLIDTALDRKEPLAPKWAPERVPEPEYDKDDGLRSLVDVRQSLEYVIFALLDYKLRRIKRHHFDFFQKLYPPGGEEPTVISLNYDLIADNSLMKLSERKDGEGLFPDYSCEISTEAYRSRPTHYGKLLKLHGSLNWLYCPGCQRLDIGISKSGRYAVKVLDQLYNEYPLARGYSCHGSPCPDPECRVNVRPVLITPTHRKDYRNPHISRVWHQAERALREAERAIFVGYSLPDDDVEVVYLLKRAVLRDKCHVVVVDEDPGGRRQDNRVYARYRSLFGGIEWRPEGFAEYVRRLPPSST